MIAAACYAVYDAVRGLVGGSTVGALRDGQDLLGWERRAHLAPEQWLNHLLDRVPAAAVPACFFYASLHFVVTLAVLVSAYVAGPRRYRPARTVLAGVTLAALVGFWLFPTAPPRLLPGGGFGDTLALFGRWGWWGAGASVPAPVAAIANQYAAMPSLHVAWACWCAGTVCSLTARRAARAVAVAYPVATSVVVLGTGNHYLLDVLAGVLLWAVMHAAGGCWYRLRYAGEPVLSAPAVGAFGAGAGAGAGAAS